MRRASPLLLRASATWQTQLNAYDDEVFVLGPLHDEMMEDLLQGGYYKWLLKLVDSCSSYIAGDWHYLVIAGYWEYIVINYLKYLIADNV